MAEQFYTDYFRDIATRMLGGADHFWMVEDVDTFQDLNSALREELALPALILRPFESPEFSIESGNITDTWAGVFTILYPATAGDFAEIRRVRELARQQAKEVLAMMRKDALVNGKLHAQRIHLMPKFSGSDEPLLAGAATGWSYDFEWRVPSTLPVPTW